MHFWILYGVPEAREVSRKLPGARSSVVLEYEPKPPHGDPIQARFYKFHAFYIFQYPAKNRRRPIFIIARSRHLAFFRGVGTPPDFSGMSNYVDSLPPIFFCFRKVKFLICPSEKVRKRPNMEIYQIWVCGAHILLFPQRSAFWDFYILNIYQKRILYDFHTFLVKVHGHMGA